MGWMSDTARDVHMIRNSGLVLSVSNTEHGEQIIVIIIVVVIVSWAARSSAEG
ncbi:hypothetical protein FOWG_17848 [Fusarium oxysporum f. sp. lycopersici MN25]|nr:hypothetical protein FOWG_17848 [Fusarium oxysporum f. sp. lycopersici MN25]